MTPTSGALRPFHGVRQKTAGEANCREAVAKSLHSFDRQASFRGPQQLDWVVKATHGSLPKLALVIPSPRLPTDGCPRASRVYQEPVRPPGSAVDTEAAPDQESCVTRAAADAAFSEPLVQHSAEEKKPW